MRKNAQLYATICNHRKLYTTTICNYTQVYATIGSYTPLFKPKWSEITPHQVVSNMGQWLNEERKKASTSATTWDTFRNHGDYGSGMVEAADLAKPNSSRTQIHA